jgi:hypothetical protein
MVESSPGPLPGLLQKVKSEPASSGHERWRRDSSQQRLVHPSSDIRVDLDRLNFLPRRRPANRCTGIDSMLERTRLIGTSVHRAQLAAIDR